jgi:hypothetical protein
MGPGWLMRSVARWHVAQPYGLGCAMPVDTWHGMTKAVPQRAMPLNRTRGKQAES